MGTVYQYGTIEVTVAALDQVSCVSDSPFSVYKKVGYPNEPAQWVLLSNETSAPYSYTSSAFTAETIVQINATASPVTYVSGTGANAAVGLVEQGAPTAMTGAATVTVAGLMSGIITGTQSTGATVAYTLPTGTVVDAGVEMAIGQAFDWVLINLSAAAADTITVTAGTDHTIVGNPIVQSAHASTGGVYGNSSQWRTRKTAANTMVSYRIA